MLKWLSTSSNGRSIQFALKETRDICVEIGKAPGAVDYYHGELYSRHIDDDIKGMTEGGVSMETIRMALSHLLKGSYMIRKMDIPATVVGVRYIEDKHVGGPERVDISHHYVECGGGGDGCDGGGGDGDECGTSGGGDGDEGGTSGSGKRPKYALRTTSGGGKRPKYDKAVAKSEQAGNVPFVTLANYKDTLPSE